MEKLCISIINNKYHETINLINSGYNLNETYCSYSALMLAIEKNDYIAKLLIKRGCDLNLQNRGGHTASEKMKPLGFICEIDVPEK